MTATSLAQALAIRTGSCVALIGAGGKTTTMLALASQLAGAGLRVAVTTTTKIWPPDGLPLVLWPDGDPAPPLRDAVLDCQTVVVAGDLGAGGKLLGLAPDDVPRLSEAGPIDVVLCEADGAAGRSLKAHAAHEPVIPPRSTHVLVLAGLDAVGEPIQSVVHRPDRFCEITGAHSEATVTPEHVASLLAVSVQFAPRGARTAVLLNRADTSRRLQLGREVACRLYPPPARFDVLATSRGRLVERYSSF